MVRITWTDPDSSGGPLVESWNVEIQDVNGAWVTPVDVCTELDIKDATDANSNLIHLCRIRMEQMEEAPYNLVYNSPIIARVQAVNLAGLASEW